MKKLSAILLITLFLFNLFGYRLVFNYVQQQSDYRLEALLDKDEYNEAELIAIKIPLSIPYQNNWDNFERIDGEITFEGKIYKYVKRKIYDGNLVLMCLPDHNKMRLESAKADFFKNTNDLVQNNGSKKSDNSKSVGFKNLIFEYDAQPFLFAATLYGSLIIHGEPFSSDNFPSSPHSTPEQPPEFS